MGNTKHNYRISGDVKEQVLKRIKEEGISVVKASEEHGISTHTIYRWLTNKVSTPTIQEFNKLKKQLRKRFAVVESSNGQAHA